MLLSVSDEDDARFVLFHSVIYNSIRGQSHEKGGSAKVSLGIEQAQL